jgi:hypothetical protein
MHEGAPQAPPATRLALVLLWLVPLAWVDQLHHRAPGRRRDCAACAGAGPLERWRLCADAAAALGWAAARRRQRTWLAAEWKQLLVLGFWACTSAAPGSTSAGSSTSVGQHRADLCGHAGGHRRGGRGAAARTHGAGAGGGRGAGAAGVLLVIAKGDLRNLLAVRFTAGRRLWIAGRRHQLGGVFGAAASAGPAGWTPGERLVAIIAGGMVVLLPTTLEALRWSPAAGWQAAAGLVLMAAVLPGMLSYRLCLPAAPAGRGAHGADAVPGAGLRRLAGLAGAG